MKLEERALAFPITGGCFLYINGVNVLKAKAVNMSQCTNAHLESTFCGSSDLMW